MKKGFGINFVALAFFRFPLHHYFLVIVAAIGLSGCEGAKKNEPDDSSSTGVVNQSGGDVALNDGNMVTFDPGIVQDGTLVTIRVLPPETPTSAEIGALSSRVRITLPLDALITEDVAPETGVTVRIPISKEATAAALTPAGVYKYTKAQLSAGADSVIYYGKAAATATVVEVKILLVQLTSLRKQGAGPLTADILVEKFSPNVSTAGTVFEIQKIDSSGDFNKDYNFVAAVPADTQKLPPEKIPLVLVHGIVTVGSDLLGCDGGAEAYKTTWEAFVKFFGSSRN